MSEQLHEITYTATFTQQLSRPEIENFAAIDPTEDLTPGMKAKILACREWLANNPQGMTREQFDKLPDGTVVAVAFGVQFMVSGGMLWASDNSDAMVDRCAEDDDLRRMKVVSTPAPPTLDDVDFVRGASGIGYYRGNDSLWRNMSRESDPLKLLDIQLIENESPLTPLLPGPQIGGDA